MISGIKYCRSRSQTWIKFPFPFPDANYPLKVSCVSTGVTSEKKHEGNSILFSITEKRSNKFKIKVAQNCNVHWIVY